jgi:GTPase
VLVGRPNVGKSTLFNRITNTRRSIVTAIAGTTRDVIQERAEWQGQAFNLVDTGGMFGASEDPLHELVVVQGQRASRPRTSWCSWWTGAKASCRRQEIAATCAGRGAGARGRQQDRRQASRGGSSSSSSSASTGHRDRGRARRGRGRPPRRDREPLSGPARQGASAPTIPRRPPIAIVGRPNVGKSSLLNRLLKGERSIVSEIPGTTRDAVDAVLKWHRRTFRIVDTAGIRRPGRVARGGQIESVSVVLSQRAIDQADVAVLLIDPPRVPPTRMPPSPVPPTRPAAASSSPPTSGT